jgi:CheY-like chemotaxis protein
MTANAFAEDVLDAKNAGMNAHIAKPLEPRLLVEVLERWL